MPPWFNSFDEVSEENEAERLVVVASRGDDQSGGAKRLQGRRPWGFLPCLLGV
jgi:hypothetical protein